MRSGTDSYPDADSHADGNSNAYVNSAGDADRYTNSDSHRNATVHWDTYSDTDGDTTNGKSDADSDTGADGYTDVDAIAAGSDADSASYSRCPTTDWWRRFGRRWFRTGLVGSNRYRPHLGHDCLGCSRAPADLDLIWKEKGRFGFGIHPDPRSGPFHV